MTQAAERRARYARFARIVAEAHDAGYAAAEAAVPAPMIVQEHASPFDDASPVTRSWHVSEGICGFAWVRLAKGTTSFARWARENARFQSGGTYMGTYYWVGQFGQSFERKLAYAQAFAEVLTRHGIDAYGTGRVD